MTDTNPLLADWHTPFGTPPFGRIEPAHYGPAIDAGIASHKAEIEAIANNDAAPDFDNTILPLEQAGEKLDYAYGILNMLSAAATSPELQELDANYSPVVSIHKAGLYQNERLFHRVSEIYSNRNSLKPQAKRLVETYYRKFIESGAALDPKSKARFSALQSRLSELYAVYKQNVLAEAQDFQLELGAYDMAGLPPAIIDATAAAATARNLPGKHIVTLAASLRDPFMTFAERRDLRETVYRASLAVGRRDNAHDNRATVLEIIGLRAELGRLMSYKDYAHFTLEHMMAKSPEGARTLLRSLWGKAIGNFGRDWQDLQRLAAADGIDELQPWDWAFYAEKLRQRELDFSAEALRPYLSIENVLAAAFHTASTLFGIQFVERTDIPTYDPDVRTWEIQDKAGRHIAVYYGDFYARHNKIDGGWMSHLRNLNPQRPQHATPVVYNVCNFNKAEAGKPSLCSLGDMETIFHELGHVLHEALTQTQYPLLAGTNVVRDFVELPSQLMEHWVRTDEVLEQFARHHATGETIPKALREKARLAKSFRQSAWLITYLGSAELDLAWHSLTPDEMDGLTVEGFEAQQREKIGMPAIAALASSTNFMHLFDSADYAAFYYIYIWAQVLDADVFEAFEEAGNVFDPETAKRLFTYIYSAGNSDEPGALYARFRGRDADPEALIRKLGFAANDASVQKTGGSVSSRHG